MESIKDHNRNHIILHWLLKTIIISVVLTLFADTLVIIVNKTEPLSFYIPVWRRILIDCIFPVVYFVWSGIDLNKQLAKYDKQVAIQHKSQEPQNISREEKLEKYRSKEPIDYLEEQAEIFRIAVINEQSTLDIDWDYLNGENKERFTKELASLKNLDEEKYQRTILYIWDRLISTYNKIQKYIEGLEDQRSKEYCAMLTIEQLVFSYLAAAYFNSTFKDPKFCYRTILNKIGKEIQGNKGTDLIRRSADYCGISESLMLRYRNDQCVKCSVRGCMGRVDETHGILELVGPYCDDTIFEDNSEQQIHNELIPVQKNALEYFKTKYGEEYAGKYVHSVIAMMGYYPEMTFRKLKEPWEWCKEIYSMPFDFKWQTEDEEPLIELIFEKIKQVKDDEKELEAVVFSLISPFDGICHSLFPKANDKMYVNGAIALHTYSIDDSSSLDEFKEKWVQSIEETKRISKEQDLPELGNIWVLDYAIREKRGIVGLAFGNSDITKISDIFEELHFYATILEAALLRYGISRDIFSYMRNSNVFLTDYISESEIGAVMDMNDDQVSTLVARYGHTLSATSEDVFTIAIENFEPDRKIDTSSIKQSKLKQHIQDLLESIGGEIVVAKEPTEEDNTVTNEHKAQNNQSLDSGINDSNNINNVVITKELDNYLSAFAQEGYLDQNYHWIRVKGHTIYHAGWMARVIKSNVPDITYGRIENIIGCTGLTDAASKCATQGKKTKIAEIEKVCIAHGLSKKTC